MKCSISKVKNGICAFFMFMVLSAIVSPSVVAITNDELFRFGQNNILFYDPTCSRYATYSGDIAVTGGTMAEKIWTGLTSFLTPEQAAGAMGNMLHEGSMNPVLHEQSFKNSGIDIFTNTQKSYGVGLIQWSFDRRVDMFDYVLTANPDLRQYFTGHSYNWDYTTGEGFLNALKNEIGDDAAEVTANTLVALELEFLQSELENKYSGFLDTSSVEEASNYFLYRVEQPANASSKEAERKSDAQKYYDMYADAEISEGTSSGGSVPNVPRGCSNSVGLSDGGFASVEEADSVLITAYKNDDLGPSSGVSQTLPTPATGDRHDNCVMFTTWFIVNYTTIELPNGSIGGDGRDIAENFYNGWVGRYPELTISSEPSVYSVASWKTAGQFTGSGNHTGIVVGIDKERDVILIAEAGWNDHSFTGVHERKLSESINEGYYYYVNVNAYLKDGLMSSGVGTNTGIGN